LKPVFSFRQRAAPAPPGRLDPSLLLGEIAIVAWLWYASCAFLASPFSWWPGAWWFSLAAVLASGFLGLHRRPPAQPPGALLGRLVVFAAVLAGLIFVISGLQGPEISPAFCLWFGAATAVLFLAFRLGIWAIRMACPDQPLEILRWLAMAGAATALMLPYYGRQGTGGGDAYWYVVMLADLAIQLRHGVFPVWIGQSEYAFNGAVSPLRLAPWIQYAGGGLDLATGHRLEPLALKNALLCVTALATAGSAYLSLRAMLPRRPGLACLLALLWLASPCTIIPLAAGSMYMQFSALAFLPPLLLGCCRLWARDDRTSRLLIVGALAALMLSHTPTALWGGLLAGGVYLGQVIYRRNWAAEGRRLAWMAGLFLVLGGLPVGSALTIDRPVPLVADGSGVPAGIAQAFPADLQPVHTAADVQVGYVLLGAGIVALGLIGWLRPRGGLALGAALLALVPLTFPIPWVTAAIWTRAPHLLVAINTSSAIGRLFEFLALIAAFALALAAADDRISRRRGRAALLLSLLTAGAVWSGDQAVRMLRQVDTMDAEQANGALRPENLALPRFAYSSFATVPAYASHAHMEPLLENRLLDRATLRVMTANAEAAAPRLRLDSEPATLPRLVQSGVWVATSLNHSIIYRLSPAVRLLPGQRYAVRLDFLRPEQRGQFQFRHPDLFRDYLLPDSGEGLGNRSVPLAFGAEASSSHVAALEQSSPGPLELQPQLVLPKYSGEQFEFARFWLYSYSPDDLPIRVTSWVPYRAETETAIPAFLETPRIWQRGWRATVNGRPVATEASPQNLVMVPLAAGPSRVLLTFHAPAWLTAWFWLCLAGWAALLGAGARRVARTALRA
jgi:hypothetical protein